MILVFHTNLLLLSKCCSTWRALKFATQKNPHKIGTEQHGWYGQR